MNYGQTTEGGSHERGVWNGLQRAFLKVSVLPRVVAVVHARLLAPHFEGPTKARLRVDESETMIRDAVASAMKQETDHRISWLEALGIPFARPSVKPGPAATRRTRRPRARR